MSQTLEELKVVINGDSKPLGTALNTANNKIKETVASATAQTKALNATLGKIAGTVAAAFSIAKVTQFSKSCIELGSNLAEVQNVIDVTFGSGNQKLENFSKTAQEAFGLSELSAKKYTSTIGAMFKSIGFGQTAVEDMSINIAKLSGDMASFYNLDTEEAFAKIRAGISGETEPLKQLGLNLSVANLEAFALSQGMTKAYNKMSQQEQTLLRYNYLLSVTADAQGDFARTSDGWANSTRILQLRMESLKATIGEGLINVLTPLLQMLNRLMVYAEGAASAFRDLTVALFGSSAGGQTTNPVSVVERGTSGIADNLASGANAAQQMMKSLARYDELNVISSQQSSSGGSLGAGVGGVGLELAQAFGTGSNSIGTVAAIEGISKSIRDLADDIKRYITKGDWDGLGQFVWKKFAGLFEGIDAKKLGESIGEKFNSAVLFGIGVLDGIGSSHLGTRLGEFVNGIVNKVDWGTFGNLIGKWFSTKIRFAIDFLKTVNWHDVTIALLDLIKGFFQSFNAEDIADLCNAIGGEVSQALDGLAEWLTTKDPNGQTEIDKMGKWIATFFQKLDWKGALILAAPLLKLGLASAFSGIGTITIPSLQIGIAQIGLVAGTAAALTSLIGDTVAKSRGQENFAEMVRSEDQSYYNKLRRSGMSADDARKMMHINYASDGDISDSTIDALEKAFESALYTYSSHSDGNGNISAGGKFVAPAPSSGTGANHYWLGREGLGEFTTEGKIAGEFFASGFKNGLNRADLKGHVGMVTTGSIQRMAREFANDTSIADTISYKVFSGISNAANSAVVGVRNALSNLTVNIKAEAELEVVTKAAQTSGGAVISRTALKSIAVPYANGGYPDAGSLFIAGEAGAEMVGNINGRTGVASGAEITGIANAIYTTSSEEKQLLRTLINAIQNKELVISPSANLGKVMAKSASLYGRAIG